MEPVRKQFVAHKNLLVDVIRRQAGTLGKALLEGVMNSIDAGSTEIRVKLTATRFEIIDDGRGFRSEQEIDDFFRQFGTPHEKIDGEVSDARYGEFRMGRGQLFAHAVNTWKTGSFQLEVDIVRNGLDFEQHVLKEPVQGCRITGVLYESLTAAGLHHTCEELARNCKYVDVPVYLNGRQVNTAPKECKWDVVTDDAYLKLSESTSRGIDVYQQGVYVETIPTYKVGISGTVVSKERLTLNFARNQVMQSCPRWKRILADMGVRAEKRLANKKELTDEECDSVLHKLVSGETDKTKVAALKIFADITGARWSFNTLRRLVSADRFESRPDGRIAYCFAPAHSRLGDRAMQAGKGLVFDAAMLEAIGLTAKTAAQFFTKLRGTCHWRHSTLDEQHFVYVPLNALMENYSDKHILIAQSKETPTETRKLRAMAGVARVLSWAVASQIGETQIGETHSQSRVLRLGISDTADAWTDGSTYVAFNQKFLERCHTTQTGFTEAVLTLIHEFCHNSSDLEEHGHDAHFLKLFHDIAVRNGASYGQDAFRQYVHLLEADGKALDKRSRREAMKETVRQEQEARLAGV